MVDAPSFSSFPDFEQSESKPRSSKQAAPSFSSFPVNEPKVPKQGDRSSSSRRERIYGERDTHERNPSSSSGDRRAERRRKEEKRQKERERANALAKGEKRKLAEDLESTTEGARGRRKEPAEDDGVPWYENGKKEVLEPGQGQTLNKSFFPDTVGDKDAIQYGSSSSYVTPRYYRDGQGIILGLSGGLRIVNSRERTNRGLEVAPLGRSYVPRYSARSIEASSDSHLRRLLVRPDASAEAFNPKSSFVTFGVHRESPADAVDIPSYRSISRAGSGDEDEETDALKMALGHVFTLEEDVRRRTIEVERHLQQHPHDIASWIAYSTLHLKLSPESAGIGGRLNSTEVTQSRANSEVALSILTRALDAHPANMASPELHLAYLHTAEAFWTVNKVTERWKNVLRELGDRDEAHSDDGTMKIWLGYIEWREGQGFGKSEDGREGVGGVDEVAEVYANCIGSLTQGRRKGGDQRTTEENQLYLFLRACLFLKHAGYSERALSAFQALVEITFFKPDDLRPRSEDGLEWFDLVMNSFEAFWDSESPRIGEPGANGWRNSTPPSVSPAPEEPAVSHVSDNAFERWLEAERHATQDRSLPGRASVLEEADEDDPYRVVLFSDLQPYLFPIRSPEARLQLIYAFLNFLGLPFTPSEVPSTAPTNTDAHLQWRLAYNSASRSNFWPRRPNIKSLVWQTIGGEPMEPEQSPALPHPFSCPVKCWTQTRGTSFARSGRWFRDLEAFDLEHIDIGVVRNVFALLRPLVPDPAFALASISFEAAVSPKLAVKLAKSMLATDRGNLTLWEGYAWLERQRGNIAAARAVYVTALQSALSDTSGQRDDDLADLWSAWAEMEWDENEEVRCLEVLVMAAGMDISRLGTCADPSHTPSSPSAVALLKSRQFYASTRSPRSTATLFMTALFVYLSDHLDSAQEIIYQELDRLPIGSADAEEAYQVLCKLLYTHSTRHASPASLTRDALEVAISSYPNNTQFLSLYLWGEVGSRVYGRVQKLVSHLTTSMSSSEEAGVIGYLWSVWAEAMSAHRTFWEQGGHGAERVRNALARGINTSIGKDSAPLWRLYIEFEILMDRLSVAKQLCYRAVAAIGGFKELYLLPFTPSLRPAFTPRELRDWSELMIERGIRIRVPFEQFWDPNEEDEGLELPEDEEPEEDELEFLKERQKMKPY